ncbi:hypothetical protein RSSM_05893 [Rhodopirellula sallentina SM41]|uniref:Uncharacterized protein n=1 Tax=Rhodopirellula sallentina SM41 TaxID=1263870 RepID=M5U485_9BACT|nr:hypothetical protein RSSM_05893 [Rhodopirellula sallentina SM41]
MELGEGDASGTDVAKLAESFGRGRGVPNVWATFATVFGVCFAHEKTLPEVEPAAGFGCEDVLR